MSDQTVYRVTFADGTSCHYGVESLARAAARETGRVEEITVRGMPDHALASRWNRIAAAESYDEMREMFFMEVRAILAAAPVAQPAASGAVDSQPSPTLPNTWHWVAEQEGVEYVEYHHGYQAPPYAVDVWEPLFTADQMREYAALLAAAPAAQPDKARKPVAWLVEWPSAAGVEKWVIAHASELPAIYQARCMNGTVTPLFAAPPAPAAQYDWRDAIMGKTVSMDVSTDENDVGHRIFGTIYEVIKDSDDTILAVEESRNFATPAAQPEGLPVDLIERIRKACTRLGIASGESLEACCANPESLLYPMCSAVDRLFDRAAPAAQPAEQCDQAFDDWYAAQRHQLTNEQVCRVIWTRGWEARGADNPEMDGTDAAHPAWWRSHDHTFAVMCEKLEKLLDGEPVVGATEPRWQRIRERIAALVTQTATPQGQEPIGWVSVKDRLPATENDVLATDGKDVAVGNYSPEYGFETNSPWLDVVTHWMTMPTAPSAGEQP